ncbi:phosphatidylinositol transfer protein 3-like [Ptychodera flava]|uniref:phosphatidylinositol transfer protein 3-like n=1 Tax=Ptychodera flava TaxID=63121 RepID=UPI00396A832A
MAPPADETEERTLVDELRERLVDVKDEEDYAKKGNNLRRYLVAKNWNLKDAEAMMKATILWRKEKKPWKQNCSECLEQLGYHSWRQVGFDKLGRPVIYACFTQSPVRKYTVEDSLNHIMYLMENALVTMAPNVYQWVWVIDCTGMPTSAYTNPKAGYTAFQTLSNHYPERLGKMIIFNYDTIFEGIFKTLRFFLNSNTIDKVLLHRNPEKIDSLFREMFDEELVHWIHEESNLNKEEPLTDLQQCFWKMPNNPADHDPRGCRTYIHKYLDTYYKDATAVESLVLTIVPKTRKHKPHPNILDDLKERADEAAFEKAERERVSEMEEEKPDCVIL